MKPCIFIFDFNIGEENRGEIHRILLKSGPGVQDYETFLEINENNVFNDFIENKLYKAVVPLEKKYGVHDWSTGSHTKETYWELIGFETYEVTSDKIPELMNEWKSTLENLGYEVENLPIEEYKEEE
jgi:hypothetical protein